MLTVSTTSNEQRAGEEVPIGVDASHNYILATTPDNVSIESFLMSGKGHKFLRQYYNSLCNNLQETGAPHAQAHVGSEESSRV